MADRGAGLSQPGVCPHVQDTAAGRMWAWGDAVHEEQQGCGSLVGSDPFQAIPCTGNKLCLQLQDPVWSWPLLPGNK